MIPHNDLACACPPAGTDRRVSSIPRSGSRAPPWASRTARRRALAPSVTDPRKSDRYTESVANTNANRGGRPAGPRMPCGWGCGATLASTDMRTHFTECPKRPTRSHWMKQTRCRCCSAYYKYAVGLCCGYCARCRSGRCLYCWGDQRRRAARVHRGRPQGPHMLCGWGCRARLAASEMRRHFVHCPNRPRVSVRNDGADREKSAICRGEKISRVRLRRQRRDPYRGPSGILPWRGWSSQHTADLISLSA